MWLIIIFGQFLEGWNQGFYQYQPFCWNFIKVFRTYHKLGHFHDKRSLDKRRDFSVYVLKINAQEWRHARGILEYANTTIQWEVTCNLDSWTLDKLLFTNLIFLASKLEVPTLNIIWSCLQARKLKKWLYLKENNKAICILAGEKLCGSQP